MPAALDLADLVAALRKQYGRPGKPARTDPFEMALRECAAYLVDDARRDAVLERLEEATGLDPEALLAVPGAALADLIRDGGMHPGNRAAKIHKACETALEVGLDELRRLVREDPPRAKRVLKRFPGFGDPGAERVLLFNGRLRGLAPDSNILRVLLRTGFGEDKGAYAKTWRAVNAAVEEQLPSTPAKLVEAHLLLQEHGRTLCRNTRPRCEACPVRARCPSAE